MKKVFLIIVAVLLALVSCVLGVAILDQENPQPATPAASILPAVRDLGAGTPGAGCATSRRGKTFVIDGVTYVCSGPKPFTWKSQAAAKSSPDKTREAARKVVKSKAPKRRAPEPAEVYYANCQAAKDAGAAPIRRGEPGYARKLDRDGDGIACDK